jgi:hypothetical protein
MQASDPAKTFPEVRQSIAYVGAKSNSCAHVDQPGTADSSGVDRVLADPRQEIWGNR